MKLICTLMIFSLLTLLCPESDPGTFFVESDIDLMARVVMSEASTQPFEAKQAVASTILNRYYSDRFPNDISKVIEGKFSTRDNGKPTEECYLAVEAAILFRDAFPQDMYWFRDSYYHSFANTYVPIGNLYFSTETDYRTNPEWVYVEGEAHYE